MIYKALIKDKKTCEDLHEELEKVDEILRTKFKDYCQERAYKNICEEVAIGFSEDLKEVVYERFSNFHRKLNYFLKLSFDISKLLEKSDDSENEPQGIGRKCASYLKLSKEEVEKGIEAFMKLDLQELILKSCVNYNNDLRLKDGFMGK